MARGSWFVVHWPWAYSIDYWWMINDYWQFVHAHLPILDGVALLVRELLVFWQDDRIKLLSTRQLKKNWISRFWYPSSCVFDWKISVNHGWPRIWRILTRKGRKMTDLATKMRKKRRKQPLPKGRLTAGGPNFGRNKYGDPGFRFFSLKSKLYPYPLFIKFRWMDSENF